VGADTWEYLYADLFSPWALSACRDPDGTLTWFQYDEAGSLYAFDRDGVRFYVGCDHLGTPRVVADSTGVAVKVVDLDAWGAVVSDSAPGFELPVGFAGGVTDPITGFVRMGMRDYDPATGRFLTRDPTLIASAQTNLYAYCNNDPLDRLDRSGLAFCAKAKAYRGYGADTQFCVSSEGVSVCAAVGFGVGAGFELEPFGELAKSGTYNEISIKGKLGPIGAGPKWKFTECGVSFKLDCDVGPVNLCQVKGKKKDLTEKPPLSGPKMKEYLKSVLKLKFGLEAVVTGGGCARITW
jgi:RHS repeat-associated protein